MPLQALRIPPSSPLSVGTAAQPFSPISSAAPLSHFGAIDSDAISGIDSPFRTPGLPQQRRGASLPARISYETASSAAGVDDLDADDEELDGDEAFESKSVVSEPYRVDLQRLIQEEEEADDDQSVVQIEGSRKRRRMSDAGLSTISGAPLSESAFGEGMDDEDDDMMSSVSRLPGTSLSVAMASAASAIMTQRRRRERRTDTQFILAIIENRAREIGVAAMDINRTELILTQFIDNSNYVNLQSMVQACDPVEVLLPSTTAAAHAALSAKPGAAADLISVVESVLAQNSTITPIARKFFNETNGTTLIKALVIPEQSSVEGEVLRKYLCVSSASALLQYVECIQKVTFAAKSLRVAYKPCKGHMLIDQSSMVNLELVQNLRTGDAKDTLYSSVNHTSTAMGSRLLRSLILQPLTDIATIHERQQCIEELLQDQQAFYALAQALKGFPDLDTMLTRFVQIPRIVAANSKSVRTAHQVVGHIQTLKLALSKIPDIADALEPYTRPTLLKVREILMNESITKLESRIDEIVDDQIVSQAAAKTGGRGQNSSNSIASRNQQLFVVRDGVNQLLDQARRQFDSISQTIFEKYQEYKDQTGISSMKLQRNARRGYFLSMDADALIENSNCRGLFIQINTHTKKLSCSTTELNSLNSRLSETMNEILLIQESVVQDLVAYIRLHIGALFEIVESIALLDLLFGFATLVSLSTGYERPTLTEDGYIAIRQGRHPVLEKTTPSGFYIANDTYLTPGVNLQIFSGANMSGKSTYLKQVAQLVILAHTGSFVPCGFATIRIVDRLFTRIGTDDSMENNAGSFLVEMKEMSYILQNCADSRSLVLIDELGRGTNHTEGCSIAWSICEYLMSLPRVYTIFTSHFVQLQDLEVLYPNIKNYHLVTTTNDRNLNFKYTVEEGSCTQDRYGIKLARMLGLPEDIIDQAELYCEKVTDERQKKLEQMLRAQEAAEGAEAVLRKRQLHHLSHKLLGLKCSSLSTDALRVYLDQLRRKHDLELTWFLAEQERSISGSRPMDVSTDSVSISDRATTPAMHQESQDFA